MLYSVNILYSECSPSGPKVVILSDCSPGTVISLALMAAKEHIVFYECQTAISLENWDVKKI